MATRIDRLLQRINNIVRSIFYGTDIESGSLLVTGYDCDREIFVPLSSDIINVWFNLTALSPPVCGGSVCWVSDAVPVPDGFVFRVNVNSECAVRWFAIVR